MAGDERESARQSNILDDLAYSTYLTRRLRQEVFSPDLFGEPAWDILLLLFSNADHSGRLSIEEINRELQISERLAARWISILASHDLVIEHHDGAELSKNGRDRLKIYLKRQIGNLTEMLQSISMAEKPDRGVA